MTAVWLTVSHLLAMLAGAAIAVARRRMRKAHWLLAGKRDAELEHGWADRPYLSTPGSGSRRVWAALNHSGDLVTRPSAGYQRNTQRP